MMGPLIDNPQTEEQSTQVVEEHIEFIPENGAFSIIPAGALRYLHKSIAPNDTATPSGVVYRDLLRAIDTLELRVCDGRADLAEIAEVYAAVDDYNRFTATGDDCYLISCSERLSYLPQ